MKSRSASGVANTVPSSAGAAGPGRGTSVPATSRSVHMARLSLERDLVLKFPLRRSPGGAGGQTEQITDIVVEHARHAVEVEFAQHDGPDTVLLVTDCLEPGQPARFAECLDPELDLPLPRIFCADRIFKTDALAGVAPSLPIEDQVRGDHQ